MKHLKEKLFPFFIFVSTFYLMGTTSNSNINNQINPREFVVKRNNETRAIEGYCCDQKNKNCIALDKANGRAIFQCKNTKNFYRDQKACIFSCEKEKTTSNSSGGTYGGDYNSSTSGVDKGGGSNDHAGETTN